MKVPEIWRTHVPPGPPLATRSLSFDNARLPRSAGGFPGRPGGSFEQQQGQEAGGWERAGAGSLGPRCSDAAPSRALPTSGRRGPARCGAPEPARRSRLATALQLRPRRPVEGSGAPTLASSGPCARAHPRAPRLATPCPKDRPLAGNSIATSSDSRPDEIPHLKIPPSPTPEGTSALPSYLCSGRQVDLGIARKVTRQIKCARALKKKKSLPWGRLKEGSGKWFGFGADVLNLIIVSIPRV